MCKQEIKALCWTALMCVCFWGVTSCHVVIVFSFIITSTFIWNTSSRKQLAHARSSSTGELIWEFTYKLTPERTSVSSNPFLASAFRKDTWNREPKVSSSKGPLALKDTNTFGNKNSVCHVLLLWLLQQLRTLVSDWLWLVKEDLSAYKKIKIISYTFLKKKKRCNTILQIESFNIW